MDIPESVLIQTKVENLMDLNDDCLLYLLRFFDLKELTELRGICLRFDNLLLHYRTRFTIIDFNHLQLAWRRRYMLDILKFLGPVIKSLKLEEQFDDISRLVVLDSIRDHCVALKSLTFKFEFDDIRAIKKFTSIVKRLKSLKLSDSVFDDSLGECFKNATLVELKVEGNDEITYNFFKHIKNLRSLSICDCIELTSECYIEILKKNLKLKQLSIKDSNNLGDFHDLAQFIANNLVKLRKLSFNVHSYNINLFGDLPYLKSLKIDRTDFFEHNFDENLIAQDLNKLLKKLSQKNNIEELTILFTEQEVIEINIDDLSKLTNLKKLELLGIQDLKNDVIEKLGTLINLEFLKMESPVSDLAFFSLITIINRFQKLKELDMCLTTVNLLFLEQLIKTLKVSNNRPKLMFYVTKISVGEKSIEFHELVKNNVNIINVEYCFDLDTKTTRNG